MTWQIHYFMVEPKLFKNRNDWRIWLEKNHDKKKELWVVFYKVKARKEGKQSMSYNEAVEEALCFGWIDSTLRRIDDEKHMQRFSPRNPKSIWSLSNKTRVEKLIEENKMKKPGFDSIRTAKENGSWKSLEGINTGPKKLPQMPEEFKRELENQKALEKFNSLAPSRQKQLLWWLTDAKKEETRAKRIREILNELKK